MKQKKKPIWRLLLVFSEHEAELVEYLRDRPHGLRSSFVKNVLLAEMDYAKKEGYFTSKIRQENKAQFVSNYTRALFNFEREMIKIVRIVSPHFGKMPGQRSGNETRLRNIGREEDLIKEVGGDLSSPSATKEEGQK